MKLYLVTLSLEVVVQADSVRQAYDVALGHSVEEVDSCGVDVFAPEDAQLLTRRHQASPEWQDSIPYGSDSRRTVREILGGES